eukprot:scaffold1513_cov100-Amphora_coffeaeformis.AAC.20
MGEGDTTLVLVWLEYRLGEAKRGRRSMLMSCNGLFLMCGQKEVQKIGAKRDLMPTNRVVDREKLHADTHESCQADLTVTLCHSTIVPVL